MRILLTGATGYLGSHLAQALVEQGHQVIVLKRSFSDTRRLAGISSRLVMYDLDRCGLDDPFREYAPLDAVVHAATVYGRNGESAADLVGANLVFPLQVLEAAMANATGLFLNCDTSLGHFLNEYALSKSQFAEWGQFYAGQGRVRFVNVKLEHFYGPGDDASKFSSHVVRSCLGNTSQLNLTLGEQKRDFIHIDDVTTALLLLLERSGTNDDRFQEYPVGSGTAVTIREFVEKVHQLTGSRTGLRFGVVPYRSNEVMESRADIRAMASLGWSPAISLDEGLRRTIAAEKQTWKSEV